MKKILWIVFAFFCIIIGIFPFIFYYLNIPFGITSLKEDWILSNLFWKIGFHTHIIFGALALLIGWTQFIPRFRNKYRKWHRYIGKIYVFSVLLSSIAAINSSFFANGGIIAFMGLFTIACIWFATTYKGYIYARQIKIIEHQKMMIYSYAATFGGVTLRIWLPLLNKYLEDFDLAYAIATWMSWIPNLIVAKIMIRQKLKS